DTNANQGASFALSLLFDRAPGRWRDRARHFSSCSIDLQEVLDLAVPLRLAIDPIPDRLLLKAHLRNQAVDCFGQIGHGGRGGFVSAGLAHRRADPLNRVSDVAGTALVGARVGPV